MPCFIKKHYILKIIIVEQKPNGLFINPRIQETFLVPDYFYN
jgi:hypothetical protein